MTSAAPPRVQDRASERACAAGRRSVHVPPRPVRKALMPSPAIRMASDYNRGLSPAVRAVHVAAASVRAALSPFMGWIFDPVRRFWAAPLVIGAVLFVIVCPFDGTITRLIGGNRVGGDVRRELTAWQQYGALGSVVFTTIVVWILDAAN